MNQKNFMKISKPNFVIIGTFKGGSSFLFELLRQHSDIFSPKKKEIHLLTPLIYGESLDLNKVDISEYYSNVNRKIILEASPAYLYADTVSLRKIQEFYPENSNFLAILRSPKERIRSYYDFTKSKLIHSDEFEEFLEKIEDAHDKEFRLSRGLYSNVIKESSYSRYIKHWENNLINNNKLKIVFFEDLIDKPQNVMDDIFDWLSVRKIKISTQVERNISYKPKNASIHKSYLFLARKFSKLFSSNSKIKFLIKKFIKDLTQKN